MMCPASLLHYYSHILRLKAFLALCHGEFHLLALFQCPITFALYLIIMDENILPLLASNKTITFGTIKPFHSTCFTICHYLFTSSYY
jgi:hypothetical protein